VVSTQINRYFVVLWQGWCHPIPNRRPPHDPALVVWLGVSGFVLTVCIGTMCALSSLLVELCAALGFHLAFQRQGRVVAFALGQASWRAEP